MVIYVLYFFFFNTSKYDILTCDIIRIRIVCLFLCKAYTRLIKQKRNFINLKIWRQI